MIQSKMMPWYMAQARKVFVTQSTLIFLWGEAFWTVWSSVMFPDGDRDEQNKR